MGSGNPVSELLCLLSSRKPLHVLLVLLVVWEAGVTTVTGVKGTSPAGPLLMLVSGVDPSPGTQIRRRVKQQMSSRSKPTTMGLWDVYVPVHIIIF